MKMPYYHFVEVIYNVLLLQHLVRYSKYKAKPFSVPWLIRHEDKWYLSSDNIRTLQEGIGDIIGAERSQTGAAATAVFPVSTVLCV